ncbi:MAG: type II toxin-antitoxin system YafQ family toxin [Chitinophagales bacterium]|nr:type II toxin-antitoxin system YafQ family toxin [Chitinophagales bacterium]
MYSIKTTKKFEKDLLLCIRRNYDVNVLNEILIALENKGIVDPQHKPHRLKDNLKGYWECHIKPDWLLIWKLDVKLKEIVLIRCDTHSDLFG